MAISLYPENIDFRWSVCSMGDIPNPPILYGCFASELCRCSAIALEFLKWSNTGDRTATKTHRDIALNADLPVYAQARRSRHAQKQRTELLFNWEVSQTLDRILILRSPNLCCHRKICKILEGLSRNFANFAMTKARRDTVLFDDLPAVPNIVDRTVSVS